MFTFNTEDLTQVEMKKILIGTVIPRPVIVLNTMDEKGVVNTAPFSYFNIVSYNPPTLMVNVQRRNGEMKDTSRNLLSLKEAVGHIADEKTIVEVNKTSADLAPDQSEIERTNLTLVNSDTVQVPGYEEAQVRYELTLNHHHVLHNEKGLATTDVFILNVKKVHLSESIYKDSYIIADELKPVGRLAGADYAQLGKEFTLIRPDA